MGARGRAFPNAYVETDALPRQLWLSGPAIVVYIAMIDFVAHMAVAGNYGYFRDELYYIVSGQHLQLGYVDFPPLIAYLAAIMGYVSGDSLFSIHVVPAMAGAALVFVTGMTARELGGGRLAQILAAAAAAITAQMAFASIFSMDIFDALWWTLGSYLLIRMVRRDEPRLWLAFGLVAGIGLMTKLTIVFFVLAALAGLLLTSNRSRFKSRWFLGAVLVSVLFVLPDAYWNATNGFPTVDFFLHHGGLNGTGPVTFALLQILIANPFNIPLVILGLYFYLRSPQGRAFRFLGLTAVILFVTLLLINGKPYFYEGMFPALLVGGAVTVEKRADSGGRWRLILPAALILGVVIGGVALAPLEMPVLPPATFVGTYGFLSGVANGAAAQGNVGQFPQYLGDRFGWDTMTASVAAAYDSLSAQQKAQACVFAYNYGEASALTFLGKGYGLPPVISGHNNFYLWGPGSCSGQVVIAIGDTAADLSRSYGNVTQIGLVTCEYCMPNENDLPIYLATNPMYPPSNVWPSVKLFS